MFVGYHEEELFQPTSKPFLYFQHIDDTFAICNEEISLRRVLTAINVTHPCLTSTFEKEVDGKLAVLDVLVEKANPKFVHVSKIDIAGQHTR